MRCQILSIATATPVHQMSQAEALQMFTDIACEEPRQARLAKALFRKAEIDTRHTVVPHTIAYNWCQPSEPGGALQLEPTAAAVCAGQSTGPTTRERMEIFAMFAADLAVESSTAAVEQAGIASRDITHLIVVTCTGFDAPGVDLELIERLQLPATTQRIQVGFMGCHGAVNGLRVAQAITRSDPSARVLMCAVELCSLHYRFTWDSEGVIGNALFADGSAAVVLSGDGRSTTHSEVSPAWDVLDTASCVIPDSKQAMSWKVGNHGFEMLLTSEVGDHIEEHLAPAFRGWLSRNGLQMDDISYWGVHPGGPKILNAVINSLGLDTDAVATSRRVLRQNGNMSSPTVLFILSEFTKQFISQRADVAGRNGCTPAHREYGVLLAFGPGLVAEMVLLSIGTNPASV